MFGQVTDLGLALLIATSTFVVVGLWYLRANLKWTELLEANDPKLASDPVRDPRAWALGVPYSVRVWVAKLRVRDESPVVEQWRVRTVNRFIVWISVSLFALLAGDSLARLIANMASQSINRYDAGFGLLLLAVFALIVTYWSSRLGRAVIDFGNGRQWSRTEVAVSLVGIVATLIAMSVMPYLDLSKPVK